jgi:hypothetical protein
MRLTPGVNTKTFILMRQYRGRISQSLWHFRFLVKKIFVRVLSVWALDY